MLTARSRRIYYQEQGIRLMPLMKLDCRYAGVGDALPLSEGVTHATEYLVEDRRAGRHVQAGVSVARSPEVRTRVECNMGVV